MIENDEGSLWLDMAEKAIGDAREMNDPIAKTQLLAIAKAYLKLAKHAREQAELRRKSRTLN
ncbi:MAG: hypothetical protein WBX25_04760 [Rhodomicrobium sp.]